MPRTGICDRSTAGGLDLSEIGEMTACVFKCANGYYFMETNSAGFVWSSSKEGGDDIIRQTDDSLEEYVKKFSCSFFEFLGAFLIKDFCGTMRSPLEDLCSSSENP